MDLSSALSAATGWGRRAQDEGVDWWWIRAREGAWRYPAALAIVFVSTVVAEVCFRVFHLGGLARVFTAGVLFAAFLLGVGPAVLAAATSYLIYAFVLSEPKVRLQNQPGEDLLLLFVFLAIALVTGGLTGRVKREVVRAHARTQATQALYEASRELSVAWEEDGMRRTLARHVAVVAKGEAVLADGQAVFMWPAGAATPPTGAAIREGETVIDTDGWRRRAMNAGGESLGEAAWRAKGGDHLDETDALVGLLVDLGAAAIGRARLAAANAEMQALARAQDLQNALLSSISHDFRTPLSVILASSSALRDLGQAMPEEARADLLLSIEEEAERLNQFVANLLNMMRLDGGALLVHCDQIDVAELARRVVQRLSGVCSQRRISLSVAGDGVTAEGDPTLFEQVLFNIVENAVRFSPDGGRIAIDLNQLAGQTEVHITDEGPGVPERHLMRIFDKFFRSAPSSRRSGTGLGLSIAKGLTEAMGGSIAADNRDDGTGLRVTVALPAG